MVRTFPEKVPENPKTDVFLKCALFNQNWMERKFPGRKLPKIWEDLARLSSLYKIQKHDEASGLMAGLLNSMRQNVFRSRARHFTFTVWFVRAYRFFCVIIFLGREGGWVVTCNGMVSNLREVVALLVASCYKNKTVCCQHHWAFWFVGMDFTCAFRVKPRLFLVSYRSF